MQFVFQIHENKIEHFITNKNLGIRELETDCVNVQSV